MILIVARTSYAAPGLDTTHRAMRLNILSTTAAALLLAAPSAMAQTLRLTPDADATVRSDMPATNYGAATELGLAKNKNASGIYFMRTFFRFDVTSLKGKPIRNATLYFLENRTIATGGLPVTAYGLTQSFVESRVTWSNKPSDDGKALSSVKVGDNLNRGWKKFDITSLVASWVSGSTNNGMVIRLARESSAGAYRPGWGPSREHATASMRPYLLVDVTAVRIFDKGCGPVATWPRLRATSGTPRLNTQMTVTGTLLKPSSIGLTVIGLSNTFWGAVKLPLMLDPIPSPPCQLLVSLDVVLAGATNNLGQQSLTFTVPNDQKLIGVKVFLQMATLGKTSHMTDGLDLLIH